MNKRKPHPRVGSDFEDFLRDEGRMEEATAVAKARLRSVLTEDQVLQLAVAETRAARRRSGRNREK